VVSRGDKFSSNGNELSTLQLTLVNLLQEAEEEVAGTTVFYFTLPRIGLLRRALCLHHAFMLSLKIFGCSRLALDCCLQVVHVPGVVMIDQGTDGLSRGMWVSPFHGLTDSLVLTRAVFERLTFDSGVGTSLYLRLSAAVGRALSRM
jgi:hypothetical protein